MSDMKKFEFCSSFGEVIATINASDIHNAERLFKIKYPFASVGYVVECR